MHQFSRKNDDMTRLLSWTEPELSGLIAAAVIVINVCFFPFVLDRLDLCVESVSELYTWGNYMFVALLIFLQLLTTPVTASHSEILFDIYQYFSSRH